MSLVKALSNAVSGLTATARGTETVATNLANAMTPGYARREMAVSAQTLGGSGGGVRIDGIARIVNASLLAETRSAEAARANALTISTYASGMEKVVGIAGNAGSLGAMLTEFQSALQSAASRPDDELRLAQVVDAADNLAQRLNSASAEVQKARTSADQAIASDVAALNTGLERVAYLNRKIAVLEAEGTDPSALVDERQKVVDAIAKIVPIQEVSRESGKIALFTKEGAVLLDGSIPAEISFSTSGQLTPDRSVGSGTVSRLVMDGVELTASQMELFSGGSLQANFAIRDDLAPKLQQDLDALAFDLHERLTDSAVDPSLTTTSAGLFTDQGNRADVASLVGLAGRIAVNATVKPEEGGQLWRVRAGIDATGAGAVGDNTVLLAISAALEKSAAAYGGSDFEGSATLAGRFALVESRVSIARVGAETETAIRNSQADTISSRFMADGVDSDAEMQKLLQYEQAYAANARVIQAIDDMMDQLLRI